MDLIAQIRGVGVEDFDMLASLDRAHLLMIFEAFIYFLVSNWWKQNQAR